MGGFLYRAAILGMMTLAGAGCIRLGGPGDVHRDVRAITGGRYEKEYGLTVGRTAMALARWSLRHAEDDDVPTLRGVRKVEIGVYEVRPDRRWDPAGRPFTAADWPEWLPLVEMQTDQENVLVLSEGIDLDIRRLMVLVEDPEELVIVRLTGDLGPFLIEAFTLAFDEAEHPELAGPALEHYQAHASLH